MKAQKAATIGAVNFLVDKLHVSTTDKQLLRHFWERLISNPANMALDKKQERKKVYRAALERHHDNQSLYIDVMNGNI